ncbi:hypothetical protein [Roseiconus lacunae]|uniref:Uncharacterized protein n=1 Tax=Roseiconus lacunae TaxID=2605694 RepID=A0ABT7PJV8_9BACT|nr:hypothetical protein [Roseiconus lacunae]MDM4016777.1 hypothetical protein [Roseiconus lacunae]
MNTNAYDDRFTLTPSLQAMDGRRLGTRQLVAFLLMLIILLGMVSDASAQDREYAPRSRSSALAKLDRFQQSVKDRIRATFGGNESEKQPRLDRQGPHESVAQTVSGVDADATWSEATVPIDQSANSNLVPPPTYQQPRYQESPEAYSRYSKPEPGGLSRAISHRRSNQDQPSEQVASARANESVGSSVENTVSMEQLLRQSPTQPVQYEQEYETPGSYGGDRAVVGPYATGTGMPAANTPMGIQPPVRQPPAMDSFGVNPPLGPPSMRSQQVPSARGAILGGDPMTATQHALRLIEENGDLKAKLATSLAEVDRLREKLASTEYLLNTSNEAVTEAQDEMDQLTQDNRQLQRQLSDSEAKYNRYLRETDRMLESIREELDEVLVRELSSGNK